jgi:ADP-ribose pyrophosphatase YjhB (NUDIX family)
MWCLPGGFVGYDEELDEAPKRILKQETNLDNIYLEQLYTFGNVNRDPRMRVISTSYMSLIDKNRLMEHINENASWFDIVLYEEKDNVVNIILDNGRDTISFSIKKELREKTTDRYSFHVLKNNSIAFDHPLVILAGLERLKNKLEYTDIVFNMMPEYFTLGELQKVYEVILGKKLLDPAFRRIIKDKVIKTELIRSDGGHRPSILYTYKEDIK